MGYRKMNEEQIYEFYRRFKSGQSYSEISRSCSIDYKTIRKYIELLLKSEIFKDDLLSRTDILEICNKLLPMNEKQKTGQEKLNPYEEYLREMIHHPHEPLKPKTAFLVVKEKFSLDISYESFKRFARLKGLKNIIKDTPMRIELSPGRETQLDYGKVGRLYDSVKKRSCAVYAFIGVLSCSRKVFIEFVYRQDQQSFAHSIIKMFNFFGGVTEFISIDNLKAGVIRPDLYEPALNKTLAELAAFYGTFINPCRVGKSTDKGKVERAVPVAREVFRRYKELVENPTLEKLNAKAKEWSLNEYGAKPHGTTGICPETAFRQHEQSLLKKLPEDTFEIPQWGEAKVHPDRFIQFNKKRYPLPPEFRGLTVKVRLSGKIVQIFHDYKLIRQFVVPEKAYAEHPGDFPKEKEDMLKEQYPAMLIKQAQSICREAGEFIKELLRPHAYLNLRRAQGMLRILEKHRGNSALARSCIKAKTTGIVHPKKFEKLLDYEAKQLDLNMSVPISEKGREMIRNSNYYLS